MLIETIQSLFTRDLNRLRDEIALYSKEENLWTTSGSISNSAGNLCLHLLGNLNTYIGKEIGKTGYVRNRDLEFSLKHIPRADLVHSIDDTIRIVNTALNNLDEADLERPYPVMVFDEQTTTGFFLVHLVTHLTYHLGQVNYHRRLLDK